MSNKMGARLIWVFNTHADVSSGVTFGLILFLHSYFFMRAAWALSNLCICTGSPGPSLTYNLKSTILSYEYGCPFYVHLFEFDR